MKRPGPSQNAVLLKQVKEQGLLGCRHHIVICKAAEINGTMDRLSGLLRADNIGHIITHMLREIELAKPYSACMSFIQQNADVHSIRGIQGIVHLLDQHTYTADQLAYWHEVKLLHERYRK